MLLMISGSVMAVCMAGLATYLTLGDAVPGEDFVSHILIIIVSYIFILCRQPALAAPGPGDRSICGLLSRVCDNPFLHHGRAAAAEVILATLMEMVHKIWHYLNQTQHCKAYFSRTCVRDGVVNYHRSHLLSLVKVSNSSSPTHLIAAAQCDPINTNINRILI